MKERRDATTDGGEVILKNAWNSALRLRIRIPLTLFLFFFLVDTLDERDIFQRDVLFSALDTIRERSACLGKVMVSST